MINNYRLNDFYEFIRHHSPRFKEIKTDEHRFCVGTSCIECVFRRKCYSTGSVNTLEYEKLKETHPEYFV